MVYDNTALANTIDIKWDMEVMEARYAEGVIFPKVLNKSQLVKESGNQVTIDIEPSFSVGTVSVGGAFTPSNTSPTQANLLLNTWVYVASEIDFQSRAQSFWNPTEKMGKIAGKVMAAKYDTDLAALHSSLTGLTAVGDGVTGDTFDDGMARIALLRTSDANIPKDSMNWFLPPVAFYSGWFTKVELTAAYSTGLPKSVLSTNYRAQILGVPSYEATTIATVGNVRKGLLLHKQAFAIGMQIENSLEKASRVGANNLSQVAVVHSLFGVKLIRSDHGIVLNIKST